MTDVTEQERAEIALAVEQVLLATGSSRFSIAGTIVPNCDAVRDRMVEFICRVVARIQSSGEQ